VWLGLAGACGGGPADGETSTAATTGSTGSSSGPGPTTSTDASSSGTSNVTSGESSVDPTSTGTTSAGDTGETSAGETSAGETGETGDPLCPPEPAPPGSWSSMIVHPGDDGYLVYEADADGNRIADFSHAGYHRGDAEIPDARVVHELAPSGGDDTAAIQQALDAIGEMPPGPDGLRGALLLAPGEFTIAGTIELRSSGVVLRGAGDGEDLASSTLLMAVGDVPHQRDVVVVGSGDDDRWEPEVAGTRTDVISEVVQVGARALEVAEPDNFAVGDHVVVVHPCTAAWLAAVDHGGTASDAPWTEDSQPLVFKRRIVAISGAELVLDAPIFNHLDRALAQSYVYTSDRGGVVTEVGVEDLRIDIETAGGEDEDHAWTAIALRGVEDAWVRRVTALHFGFAGVTVATGVQITVADVRALDPVAQVTGSRMYNFDVSGGQQVLFTDCEARGGRHHYVSNGTSWTSGVVFHRSRSLAIQATSEGHRRWSMGLLYDNVTEVDPAVANGVLLGLHNRGDYGTGHGWASAHSVVWGHDLAGGTAIIQQPPTAQNYAIGGLGTFTGESPPAPFAQPEGYIEGSGVPELFPASLYERQLAERRCEP
jgi:hypothetical protein